jgi:hypothetical protein
MPRVSNGEANAGWDHIGILESIGKKVVILGSAIERTITTASAIKAHNLVKCF